MSENYISARTFNDFKDNQDEMIKVLNHSMTRMSYDIRWLKQLTAIQLGVILAGAISICIGSVL
jgi:hypothetical protein